ncbi:MAG: hypothetical protein COA57_13975 [Flavobacteriales bacterium]|nr:MAG: hypothetical protein COA57_13975 [Flavobacteriales bacterium]
MKTRMLTLSAFMLVCLLSLNLTSQAQQERGMLTSEEKDKMESFKIAYLTRELSLTPDDAKIFWPVYDQYSKELDKLRNERMKERDDAKRDFDNLSDKDMEKVVDGEIIFRQRELNIQKKYHDEFKKVLHVKKVAKLYMAEQNFKRKLLQRMREKRGQGAPHRGGLKRP